MFKSSVGLKYISDFHFRQQQYVCDANSVVATIDDEIRLSRHSYRCYFVMITPGCMHRPPSQRIHAPCRVAVLYGLRDYFACRHCYGLAYESQHEPTFMRGLLKAHKILIRLGAKPDVFDPFPEKPPGMHWRTYERLHRGYEIAKDRSLRGVLGRRPSDLP
jgi:hypothetical protein